MFKGAGAVLVRLTGQLVCGKMITLTVSDGGGVVGVSGVEVQFLGSLVVVE